MAYITVTTLADLIDPIDGKVSLREAVAQANATRRTPSGLPALSRAARRWC